MTALAQLAELRERLTQVERSCAQYEKLVALLQEANERLKRGLMGHTAERFTPGDAQLSLAILQLALGGDAGSTDTPAAEAETQTVGEHERRKPVRKPIPEHVPRVPIEMIPEEVKREGLDAFEVIGTETREVLERRPASACSIVSMGSLVTKYHAIGSCPFGQLRSVTATTFVLKLVGDPGAKFARSHEFDRPGRHHERRLASRASHMMIMRASRGARADMHLALK